MRVSPTSSNKLRPPFRIDLSPVKHGSKAIERRGSVPGGCERNQPTSSGIEVWTYAGQITFNYPQGSCRGLRRVRYR